ncbi:hypothetical protein D3C85_874990 [compost metagenome]
MTVGFNLQRLDPNALAAGRRLMQAGGQAGTQAFARHLEDIVDARLARSRFQVHATTAMQVKNVALGVDQRSDRWEVLQEGLFGHFAQRWLAGENGLGSA